MNPLIKTYNAGAAVAASRFVKFGAADGEVIQATDSSAPIVGVSEKVGVSQADFDAGRKRIDIVQDRIAYLELGGVVTRGDWLTADAIGKGVAANLAAVGSIHCGAKALASGVSGDIILVQVFPIVVRTDVMIAQTDVTITSAQLLALNATPQTLIAAPGVGKAIVVEDVQLHKPAGTAYAGIAAGEDLAVKYSNAAGAEVCQIETTGFLDQAGAQYRQTRPTTTAAFTPVDNAPVVLHLLVGEIITGNSDLKVRIRHRTVDVSW